MCVILSERQFPYRCIPRNYNVQEESFIAKSSYSLCRCVLLRLHGRPFWRRRSRAVCGSPVAAAPLVMSGRWHAAFHIRTVPLLLLTRQRSFHKHPLWLHLKTSTLVITMPVKHRKHLLSFASFFFYTYVCFVRYRTELVLVLVRLVITSLCCQPILTYGELVKY